MSDDTALDFMTSWFAEHCDGDWEHDLGIRIETLDNPGWALDVRLGDTELDGVISDWHRREDSDDNWLHWRSTGDTFEARCGPGNLSEALVTFRAFAQEART
jgi:hypothetical protein